MAQRLPRTSAAAVLVSATCLLQACAGLNSSVLTPTQTVEGLSYHLPMRYFVLTVERAGGITTTAEWSESELVADTRKAYALNYHPHLIGKTETTIEVSASGLLSTADTKTTDSAAELAKIIEKKVPPIPGARIRDTKQPCAPDGKYIYLSPGVESGTICDDVEFSVSKMEMMGNGSATARRDADDGVDSAAGIFYRQQRPYIVHVRVIAKGADPNKEPTIKVDQSKILLAPNDSPTMLLPYARTLFAENDGQITLKDGMPQKYKQSTNGEFVALLQVPAAVLSAYFTAVGNVFSAFSSKETKEQELAVREYKLALLAYKLDLCKEALKKKDSAAMDSLQCNSLPSNP